MITWSRGSVLQEFRVLLRKDAAGGKDPTYDIELWETGGGTPLATLVSGATLSSDTGEVVSVTWDASLLGTPDGSAVELKVVGHRSGGSPSKRRTVEVGAVEWNVDHQGAPSSELYFLRARYYDPETGRFLGQDALPAANAYAYVGNNPVRFVDPSGLCHVETGLWDQICGRWAHRGEGEESYTGGDQADERGEDTEGSDSECAFCLPDDCPPEEVFYGGQCTGGKAKCYGFTLDRCVYSEGSPWWEEYPIRAASNIGPIAESLNTSLNQAAGCWEAQASVGGDAFTEVLLAAMQAWFGKPIPSEFKIAGWAGILESLIEYSGACSFD